MPFGSVFSKFRKFSATTADGKTITFRNNAFTKLGFQIIGMPHIGIRLRAGKIIKNMPQSADRVLDAGCGTGIYAFTTGEKNKNARINAVDISAEKIKQAKEINIFENVAFSAGDLCKLKFENNAFEAIICSDVLEHIKNDEKAFSELIRVLEKQGTLILTVPFNSSWNQKTYKKYEHEKPGYTRKDFEKLCAKYNCRIEKIEYYSYPAADKISNFSYKFTGSRALTGILFYPLYAAAMLADIFLKHGEPNGMFVKIIKNN